MIDNSNSNAQGALEYLLMIGAAILVVAIVIIAISGLITQADDQNSSSVYDDQIQNLEDFINKSSPFNKKLQVILIGVDGVQYKHYREMMTAGKMPNFVKLIGSSGFDGNASITGHTNTATKPGNAELQSGLGSSITFITANNDGKSLPKGKSIFERLNTFSQSIIIGSIYGKDTNGKTPDYLPKVLLSNAIDDVDWWKDLSTPNKTFAYDMYLSDKAYANSISVANEAAKFINSNYDKNFYLFVYFGVPDKAGHLSGENSLDYNNSLINVDDGLGIILNSLNSKGILGNTKIIVSGDHGWNEGTTGHATNNFDTNTVILVSNDSSLLGKLPSMGKRKQCDIAPTILNYFGMNPNTSDLTGYKDITDFGCGSLISQ